jgi:hypothetical protein
MDRPVDEHLFAVANVPDENARFWRPLLGLRHDETDPLPAGLPRTRTGPREAAGLSHAPTAMRRR